MEALVAARERAGWCETSLVVVVVGRMVDLVRVLIISSHRVQCKSDRPAVSAMTTAIYAHGGCVQPTLASKQVCLRGRET